MNAQHPYEATMKQMRKSALDGGGFASLSDQQKWEWHADVYAFNRVLLARIDSPADPEGKWFSEGMVEIASRYYRLRYIEPRERRQAIRFSPLHAEGRRFLDRWAQRRGHADWESAYEAGLVTAAEVVTTLPGPAQAKPPGRAAAADLGAVAREYAPTAEQMAAGRAALGMGA